jgi:hypothetical protein
MHSDQSPQVLCSKRCRGGELPRLLATEEAPEVSQNCSLSDCQHRCILTLKVTDVGCLVVVSILHLGLKDQGCSQQALITLGY